MTQNKDKNWFWDPLLGNWTNYANVILATLLINVFALAVPIYTMNIYDHVVPTFSIETLYVLTFGIVLALLFDFSLKVIRGYIIESASASVGNEYDYAFMDHLFDTTNTTKMSVGEKVSLFRELQTLRDYYATRMAPTIVDFPFLILFVLVIYWISPAIAVVPIVAIMVLLLSSILVQIPIQFVNKKYYVSLQSKSAAMVELLSGLQAIRGSNANEFYLNRWVQTLNNATNSVKKSQLIISAHTNFSMFVAQIVTIAVLFVGVFEISNQNLTIGGLIAITILSGRIISPVINISAMLSKRRQTHDILNMIDRIMEEKTDSQKFSKYHMLDNSRGKIDLHNVSYSYSENSPTILKNLTLKILEQKKIAIIGPSGSGKSTLMKMIAGLITPTQGHIDIDDRHYNEINHTSLRQAIGYVGQDSFFFNATVQENILLGNEINEDFWKTILKDSGLTEHLKNSYFSLDKLCGENGNALSGGQKRSISIARSLVSNPRILLLDEPSNDMDQVQETLLMDNISKQFHDKTIIVITHKTTLIPMMDHVIFMNNGEIAASGTPADVMAIIQGQKP